MVSTRRALMVTAVVALLIATAGCLGGDEDLEQPDLEQLQADSIEAMEDVETASFDMTMSMEADGESQSVTMDLDAEGEMNVPEQRMRMTATTEMMGQDVEIEQYVIGDTMYMNQDGRWAQEPLPDANQMWEQEQQIGAQREALEGAEIEYAGTETVNGEAHHVVEVQVTEEVLQDLMEAGGTGQQIDASQLDLGQTEITQYIHPDTNYVTKTEMDMSMEMQGQTMEMSMSMTLDDINEPVNIELPAEATA